MRITVVVALAASILVATAGASYKLLQAPVAFRATIERIDAAQSRRMTGVSWRRGCPVPLRDLRLLTLTHWGFDGRVHTGRLVVTTAESESVRQLNTRERRRFGGHKGAEKAGPQPRPEHREVDGRRIDTEPNRAHEWRSRWR